MGEAVFGLLGVVIGGLLTGTIGYLGERRREARQTRADARLILMNYRLVNPYIEEALRSVVWPPPPPNIVWSYNIWLSARPNLASTLPVGEWDALEEGMRMIEEIIPGEEATGQPIDPKDEARLRARADSASKATATLVHLAGRRVAGAG